MRTTIFTNINSLSAMGRKTVRASILVLLLKFNETYINGTLAAIRYANTNIPNIFRIFIDRTI